MRYRHTLAWMSLLLILALVVSGCAPRIGAGQTSETAAADAVVVDLPSIAIDVAEDGSLSMGGIPVAALAGSLGVPANLLALPPDLLKTLSDAGIQHVQIANRPDGLALVLNGYEIPSLRWTPEQLSALGGMLGSMPELAQLLPLLTQLGVGVTLRLPVPAGAEPAPLLAESQSAAAARLATAEETIVSEAGSGGTINLPIQYAQDGSWTLGGIDGQMVLGLAGMDMLSDLLKLNVPRFQELGISSVNIHTDSEGLHLATDGTELLNLDWSGGRLANLIELALSTGMVNVPNLDPATMQAVLDRALGFLTTSDVNVSLNFPAP